MTHFVLFFQSLDHDTFPSKTHCLYHAVTLEILPLLVTKGLLLADEAGGPLPATTLGVEFWVVVCRCMVVRRNAQCSVSSRYNCGSRVCCSTTAWCAAPAYMQTADLGDS